MSDASFALYGTSALAAAQRATEGQVVDLDRPLNDAGVTLFRKSFWLPVPAALAAAQAADLAPESRLRFEFSPRRYAVDSGDALWFPEVEHLPDNAVRIALAWPAAVVRVAHPADGHAHAIALLRTDGDAVAAEPTLTGVTGSDLAEPWIGSPLVIRVGARVIEVDEREPLAVQVKGRGRERAVAAPSPLQTMPAAPTQVAMIARLPSTRVPALTLAGRPTSPRLMLYAERASGAVLLWQSMLPGIQGTVELPGQPIASEWAAALEQVRSLLADPVTAPTRLRLVIESDAPCRVRLAQLQLAVQADFELLQVPQKLVFGGERVQHAELALTLPAGAGVRALRLAGRVVADAAADAAAGSAPVEARRGALLGADQAAWQPIDLVAPRRCAGLALYWQPLSEALRLSVRLRTDAQTGPGARVVASAEAALTTPEAGWLALRWPTIDLQAQRLWVELTVVEGMGLWPFGDGPAGWTETHGAPTLRQALPQALRLQALGPADEAPSSLRPISLHLGHQVVAPTLPAGALSLEIPTPLLPLLDTLPLRFASGVRGQVTVDSARLRTTV